jgi:osmoprotectant transport system substrate-binding protein
MVWGDRQAHDEDMRDRGGAVRAACLVLLAVLCGACTSGGDRASTTSGGAGERAGSVITVGSFDFPESVLLAHIYARALAAQGFRVRVADGLGTRELVQPALMKGLIQLVPEYSGSALGFMSLGKVPPSSDASATHRALERAAETRGLVVGNPAPAQDNNSVVVTRATAVRYHLRSISDLAVVAPGLVFGGPPECPERAYCLPGLERTYGLIFKDFVPTDVGGPLTRQALSAGQVDVGLLFTTDPSLAEQDLVALADDRGLQPAENVTPLITRKTAATYGPRLLATLDAVSARLATDTLRSLNARVQGTGLEPRAVAADWLRGQALISRLQGVR